MKKSCSPTASRKCFVPARDLETKTETAQRPAAPQAATD